MTQNNVSDRRKYFRIDDEIKLAYHIIDDPEPTLESVSFDPKIRSYCKLISGVESIDNEANLLLVRFASQQRDLGQYLRLLNKKFDLISQAMLFNSAEFLPNDLMETSLSEGGLSFVSTTAITEGANLAVTLIVSTEYRPVLALAKVSSCVQKKNEQYDVHIDFFDIAESDQQLIARHVLKVQQDARRREREALEENDPLA